jgi:ATP-dependent DNA helicase RecG
VADLGCDTKLLQEAQAAADELLARDPELRSCPATAERATELLEELN